VIYATNILERVHARIRKVIKTRGLALRNITAQWDTSQKSSVPPLLRVSVRTDPLRGLRLLRYLFTRISYRFIISFSVVGLMCSSSAALFCTPPAASSAASM
jgi:hypothetical protein